MKPTQYHWLLLLLLVSPWTTNWQPQASSPGDPRFPSDSEVYPIARIYRQQIDDQIVFPILAVACPVPLILAFHPSQTLWQEDALLANLNYPDPLSSQMSLQL